MSKSGTGADFVSRRLPPGAFVYSHHAENPPPRIYPRREINPLPFTNPGPCNAAVPQTAHAGGIMNVALLDGSVRGIDGLIAGSVWWSLCTPRGGESAIDGL